MLWCFTLKWRHLSIRKSLVTLLFVQQLRRATQGISNVYINDFLWEESISDQWIPFTNGQSRYLMAPIHYLIQCPWWRHQMEKFSALLALCAGNSPVPVNSPHKGQWRGALMFILICARINDWVNNREAGDLRRLLDHYDVSVMSKLCVTGLYEVNPLVNGGFPLQRASNAENVFMMTSSWSS